MISLAHLLLLAIIIFLCVGPSRLPRLSRSIGEGVRNFKKALRGQSDIDITHSVKRLPPDDRES